MRAQTNIHSRLVIALLVVPPAVLYLIVLLGADRLTSLTTEDSPVETFGALCLIAAGIVFLMSFRARHNVVYLLFGLLFLFGALEEISYGQRIFGFATPSFFREHNGQGEFNIHNLEWFRGVEESGASKGFVDKLVNMDRLFSVFWFGYCVFIPVVCHFSVRAWRLAQRIRLPIVPLAIGMVFVLNYVVSKALVTAMPSLAPRLTEIKETNFAYLFACFAMLEYLAILRTKRAAKGVPVLASDQT